MRKLISFAFVETCLIGLGAGADRMLPEIIPTWAIVLVILISAAGAAGFYFWSLQGEKQDTESIRKIIQQELSSRDYRVDRLRETVKSLPHKPLGTDGATYAELPHGTNVVTTVDGSIRLALPVHLSASFEGGLQGNVAMAVEKGALTVESPPVDDGRDNA